jgi:hypothetical protein
MIGTKQYLKQTLEIADTTLDPRTKLQARAIANDCYKYIMALTTNGVLSLTLSSLFRQKRRN